MINYSAPPTPKQVLTGMWLQLIAIYLCLEARDAGGSMVIHTFGGYYGLSISWMLYRPNLEQSSNLQGSVYHSDVFAMIGGCELFHNSSHFSRRTGRFLWSGPFFFPRRYTVPVDVLAQLQLSHHRPRRRPAQSSHQYLPGTGLHRTHYCGHLKPLPEAWKARHGKDQHR